MTLIFVKLGGSLITDKREEQAFRAEVTRTAVGEIAAALNDAPDLRLVIGHGGGSYGHTAAARHGTVQGVQTPDQWRGFAEVAMAMRDLNVQVLHLLFDAGIPAFTVQPSASLVSTDGQPQRMDVAAIQLALDHGLVPVLHGDVAFDSQRGGTIISTETIFSFLAKSLHPDTILLLGEVEGVLDANGAIIPHLHPGNFADYESALRGSHGEDVTGGMASKVRDMLKLVTTLPGLEIRIMSGAVAGQIHDCLMGVGNSGTRITAR
ncbi:MAG: isopentenyl phosphate kinase [Anaerolineae bacterium]